MGTILIIIASIVFCSIADYNVMQYIIAGVPDVCPMSVAKGIAIFVSASLVFMIWALYAKIKEEIWEAKHTTDGKRNALFDLIFKKEQ